MNMDSYKAMLVSESARGQFTRQITQRLLEELPAGEVLIRVAYSSLNYKDALSASGNKGVTRQYPHTPGIDAAGEVAESASQDFRPGDEVIVTGYDLGMNTSGGFGEYVRVPAAWIVPLPQGLSLRHSMIYGTAGFTAALSVFRLEKYGIAPEQGEILVTGASGGVGSLAVSLLARAGFPVVAASGKPEQTQLLLELGAKQVIPRDEARDASGKVLLRGRWAGGVDTVGGEILATTLKSTKYGGAVTSCGNVASPDLSLTVYPFILRGVSLLGIDSVNCPMETRLEIWRRLSQEWKLEDLDRLVTEIGLGDLEGHIQTILQGKQVGRVLVNLNL